MPDMSAAPQCASGVNEQYCFAGHCRPAMPPHIFSCVLPTPPASAMPPFVPPPPALEPPMLPDGAALEAPARGVVGSCGLGVAGVHAAASQPEPKATKVDTKVERMRRF